MIEAAMETRQHAASCSFTSGSRPPFRGPGLGVLAGRPARLKRLARRIQARKRQLVEAIAMPGIPSGGAAASIKTRRRASRRRLRPRLRLRLAPEPLEGRVLLALAV